MRLFCCLSVLVFAVLIDHAAGGLASGLAGGLALAATAILYGVLNILGFNGLNSFHVQSLLISFVSGGRTAPYSICYYIIFRSLCQGEIEKKRKKRAFIFLRLQK